MSDGMVGRVSKNTHAHGWDLVAGGRYWEGGYLPEKRGGHPEEVWGKDWRLGDGRGKGGETKIARARESLAATLGTEKKKSRKERDGLRGREAKKLQSSNVLPSLFVRL